MSREERKESRDRVAPAVGGTSTPIAGSRDGTGERDPVMSREAGRDSQQEDQDA
jgi:hypothetical protein